MDKFAPGEVTVSKGDIFSSCQRPKNLIEKDQVNQSEYASTVVSRMYNMICIRPEISFIVGMLGRFQQNPGVIHWKAVKKVLRYLQKTEDYSLVYKRSEKLEVVGFSDSDFAGYKDSKKSTSGYIFTLVRGAISWRSAKQTLVASSIMKADYVACFEVTQHVVWLKNFISGLKVVDSISRPIRLCYDNAAVVIFF